MWHVDYENHDLLGGKALMWQLSESDRTNRIVRIAAVFVDMSTAERVAKLLNESEGSNASSKS